jgi:hypothetical protein
MEVQGHYRSMQYRAFSMGCGGERQIPRQRLEDCYQSYQSSLQPYQVNAVKGEVPSTHSFLSPCHSLFIIKLSIMWKCT